MMHAPTPSAASPDEEQSESEGSVGAPKRKRQRRIALACNVSSHALTELINRGANPASSDATWRAVVRMTRANHARKQERNVSCRRNRLKSASVPGRPTDRQTEYPTEYITFLESRIASLEERLAQIHPDDILISDHLPNPNKRPSQPQTTANEDEESGEVKNEIAAGVALLSLNSVSEPHYLGGSSGYSWAKVLMGTLHRPPNSLFHPDETFHTRYTARRPYQRPSLPSREVAAAMVDSFYCHVQARYPFMDWRRMRELLARQEEMVVVQGQYPFGTNEWREKGTATFFIWYVHEL